MFIWPDIDKPFSVDQYCCAIMDMKQLTTRRAVCYPNLVYLFMLKYENYGKIFEQ